MKAVQILGAIGAHQLTLATTAAKPTPQKDQILVKVSAAGVTADEVNWPELYRTTNRIPGHDVSGTIEQLGPDYSGPLKAGDAVFMMLSAEFASGGQAEYVVADPQELASKPTSISHAQAAALPIPFLTAWEAIFVHAKVERASKVLVTGATGAVGNVLVQVASRVLGCEVVALASAKNEAYLKTLGANTVVDYNSPDWQDSIKNVDAVFDTVGSETLAKAWSCVKEDGYIVTVADPAPSWAFGKSEAEELKVHPRVKCIYFIVTASGEILSKVAELLDNGTLTALPVNVFAADQALEAWKYAGQRGKSGKAVIEFAS